MRIEIDRLGPEGQPFSYTYEPAELVLNEAQVRLIAAPSVTGHVRRKSGEIRVRGQITARAEVDCDRCLGSVVIPVERDFDVGYVPPAEYAATETAELQSEDLDQSVFEDEAIDVDELVREQVLLALPARVLCRDECRGLCPACGANRNIDECLCADTQPDPRWSALADFKSDGR